MPLGSFLWYMCYICIMSIYWHAHEFPCQMSLQDIARGWFLRLTVILSSRDGRHSPIPLEDFLSPPESFSTFPMVPPCLSLYFSPLLGPAPLSHCTTTILPSLTPHRTHTHPLCWQTPSIDFPLLWHIWCSRMWPINYIHSRLSSHSPFPNNTTLSLTHTHTHTAHIYVFYY